MRSGSLQQVVTSTITFHSITYVNWLLFTSIEVIQGGQIIEPQTPEIKTPESTVAHELKDHRRDDGMVT